MSEKAFFRNRQTGDLGWLVEENGQKFIQLDRPNKELRPYAEHSWKEEDPKRPLSRRQLGMLTFEYDRILCRFLGRAHQSRKEWTDLSNEQQNAWMDNGPKDGSIRERMWLAAQQELEDYTGE